MPDSRDVRRRSLLRSGFAIEPLEIRRLLASISGEVYSDFNGNGKLDPGENGAAFQSQLIFLDQNDNGVADPGEPSTSVDQFGDYSFGPLAAGTYRVRLQQDQGFARTSPSTDSDLVTVTANQAVTGINFGITQPSSSITGIVFNDANGNAKQDSNEPALQGATPYLDMNNNGKLDSVQTTLSSTNVPVTAAGISAVASNLSVSGLSGFVLGVTVKLNITSPNDNDPDVFLEDPQGVRVELVDPVDTASQDNGHNFVNTVFDDNASKPISEGTAPFTGSFQTSGLARGAGLSDFKNLSPNGTWRLILEDTATPNTAKLTSWSITLTTGDPTTFQKSQFTGDYFILSLYPGTYKVRTTDTNFITTFPTSASGQSYSTTLTEGTIKTDNFGMREVNTVKQTVTFAAATNPTHFTEDSPFGIVQGDFNKDGKLDLATVNNGSNDVSIYLGNGNGTFKNPVFYPIGSAPRGIAMADLNGDGNMDLVVTNHDDHDIAVLLGNSNGTFKPRVTYAVGMLPWTVALADVTGDGKLDAIVGSNGIPDVTILPGNGNGTFNTAAAITVPAGNYPMGVRVADMNGDNKPDIITCNSLDGTVGVLLNKGNGIFGPVITTTVGSDPEALNAVDLNGDKKMDVVVANQGDDTIDVLLGNGNGTFQAPETYATGDTPAAVNLGDLNNDGKTDVIVSDRSDGGTPISGDVRVYLSNGDGTLQPPFIYTAHTSPVWAAVGDFNKDGKPDLAVANFNSDDVSILLNTTTPFVPQSSTFSFSGNVFNDANGNGVKDAGETGITGVTVYVDSNNDKVFESTEPHAVTDASGNYTITGVAPSNPSANPPYYVVRQTTLPTGFTQTLPTGGLGAHVTITNSNVTGINFGDKSSATTPPPVTLQAETATLAGGTVASSTNAGYTGSGYADFGSTNSSATFAVTTSAAGSKTLTFRYANGSTANRPLSVAVNGAVVGSVTFAPTGSWTIWATVTLSVNLLSGSNSIRLSVTGTDGPNLDWMSVA